jgi:hypothetical protein
MTAAATPRPASHLRNRVAHVTRYDYEWQKPKAAIYVDKTPAVDLVELGQEQEFLAWVKVPLRRYLALFACAWLPALTAFTP